MQYFDQTWYDCTIDRLAEIVKGKNGFLLYDIGAGNSVLEERVKALNGTWVGFDYKPRKAGIIQLNLEKPISEELVKNHPDVILLLEVIEHLFNPGQAVENISLMAKPGTKLILTTPNPFWSVVRLKFLLLNKFPMFEKSDMEDNHHVYTAWPHVMERILNNNGFTVQQKFTIGQAVKFPNFTFSIKYPGKIIVYFLRKILEAINPESKGMSYGFIAIKN